MRRPWPLARRYGFDVLVAVGAAFNALEIAFTHDPLSEPTTSSWFAVPAGAALVLPLLGRRRFPFAAPASVWLLGAGISFVDGWLVTGTGAGVAAGLASSFLLGRLDAVRGRVGLAIVVAGISVVVYNDPARDVGELLFTPILFVIAWLAGLALRDRAAQAESAEGRARHAEREREAAGRIAAAEERARIARELHDIVAHAVSVMVLQVGAVRHNLPEGLDQDRDALRAVETAGRTALAEMRRLLGAMRSGNESAELAPQPGLDALDVLLHAVEGAGLPVRLQVAGEPVALPRAIDLSAYRIVQEGLTNALKHSRARHAEVVVHYGREDLQIDVRDDGQGGTTSQGGHGLTGVRERVKIYGGEMSAGTVAGGGFLLSTRLPLDGYR